MSSSLPDFKNSSCGTLFTVTVRVSCVITAPVARLTLIPTLTMAHFTIGRVWTMLVRQRKQ